MQNDFYIGWQDRAAPGVSRRLRIVVLVFLVMALVLGGLLAGVQRTIGRGIFEWGRVGEVAGVFLADPQPRLLVARPGQTGTNVSYSSYLLVRPFKFGLSADLARRFAGQPVRLKGTFIHRNDQTMIEALPETMQLDPAGRPIAPVRAVPLGQQTLRGEIVDSKCYLGVMNPGQYIPHRACAIRCISGGIPPLFVVHPASGPPLHFLLLSADGGVVGNEILEYVAESVEITGAVEQSGELLLLKANPATIHRVSP